jgi:hypothetical protein
VTEPGAGAARLTGVERRHVPVVLGLLVTLAACGSGTDPAGSGGPPSRENPSSRVPAPSEVPAPSTSAGVERKGDLVHGVMTLEGVLEHTPHCLVLRVGTDRWELRGASADLRAGTAVRVRGRPAAVREGCGADRAVVVSSIRAR